MGISLILSILAIIGVVVVFWFLQRKINHQKQQTRKTFESLETHHETQLRETLVSLEEKHQTQLAREMVEVRKQLEARLQEAIASLQASQPTPAPQAAETPEKAVPTQPTASEPPEEIPPQIVTRHIDRSTALPEAERQDQIPEEERQEQTPEESVAQPSQEQPEQPPAEQPLHFSHPKTQALGEEIRAMGDSARVTDIPRLIQHASHSESRIRQLAAASIGRIASSQGVKAEVQRAIPVLGNLCQDPDAAVRQSAVEALGQIKSEKAIPFLKLALRDSDSDVVKVASDAISHFKFYSVTPAQKSPPKSPPKPSQS
jgi:hypothetical protein